MLRIDKKPATIRKAQIITTIVGAVTVVLAGAGLASLVGVDVWIGILIVVFVFGVTVGILSM